MGCNPTHLGLEHDEGAHHGNELIHRERIQADENQWLGFLGWLFECSQTSWRKGDYMPFARTRLQGKGFPFPEPLPFPSPAAKVSPTT